MTARPLAGVTTAELVARFTDLALAQDKALFEDQLTVYNALYDRIARIRSELKSRPGDERRALQALFDHKNPQVRLMAASSNLSIDREVARGVLQRICDRGEFPQAGEAGMLLSGLDDGTFVPS